MEQGHRLIDASLVYMEICRLEKLATDRYLDTPSNSPAITRYGAKSNERARLKQLIERAPTVDAVSVILCRNCKSANVRDDMGEDFYECQQNGVTVFCNGGHFCSYGKPRTESNK